jgi:hypothetical protein
MRRAAADYELAPGRLHQEDPLMRIAAVGVDLGKPCSTWLRWENATERCFVESSRARSCWLTQPNRDSMSASAILRHVSRIIRYR